MSTTSRRPKGAESRRVMALWLPHLPAERPERGVNNGTQRPFAARPFAVWRAAGQRHVIVAANRTARKAGVAAGMVLADAHGVVAELVTMEANTLHDARTLARLAAWCRRFSPWTAPFGGLANARMKNKNNNGLEDVSGIWLEVTGCAHLFGGETAMAQMIVSRFARASLTAHAGLAATPGAAWALARCCSADGPAICLPNQEPERLADIPVAALRLDAATAEGLSAVGLRRIGDLYPFLETGRRAGLARRFPAPVLDRLDAALGRTFEPISPTRPTTRHIARFESPEPVREGAVARVADRLVHELCTMLARDGLGARRLALSAFRSDGRCARIGIGTARPVADATTLQQLLALRLDRLDLGPGADAFALEAVTTEPLRHAQADFDRKDATPENDAANLAPLLDRLSGRLGRDRVGRLALKPNHLPERAQGFVPAVEFSPAGRAATAAIEIPPPRPLARPVRLLHRPEPVEAVSQVPDGPPAWFRWRGARHRIARAEGPERIALDWWTLPGWQANPDAPGQPPALGAALRDYWRVEDADGARFWLYRDSLHRQGVPARWHLHGVFP